MHDRPITLTVTYGGDLPDVILADILRRAKDGEWVLDVSAHGQKFESVVIAATADDDLILRPTLPGDFQIDPDRPGVAVATFAITHLHVY